MLAAFFMTLLLIYLNVRGDSDKSAKSSSINEIGISEEIMCHDLRKTGTINLNSDVSFYSGSGDYMSLSRLKVSFSSETALSILRNTVKFANVEDLTISLTGRKITIAGTYTGIPLKKIPFTTTGLVSVSGRKVIIGIQNTECENISLPGFMLKMVMFRTVETSEFCKVKNGRIYVDTGLIISEVSGIRLEVNKISYNEGAWSIEGSVEKLLKIS